MSLLKRAVLTIGVLALAMYGVLFVVSECFSNHLLFQPGQTTHHDKPDDLKLRSADGSLISATYLPHEHARFTILYSHANNEDIDDVRPLLENINDLGFNTLAYDYQGYGTSQGRPSERHVYDDERAAYDYLTRQLQTPPAQIILLGQGLGTGPAIELASHEPVGGLVISSGYVSAFRVITRWRLLPFDRFENVKKMPAIHCPVLVIHGREDDFVPLWHGEALYAAANQPKQFAWIDKGGHMNLDDHDSYYDALQKFGELISDEQDKKPRPTETKH